MKHSWFVVLAFGCHSGPPDVACSDCGDGSGVDAGGDAGTPDDQGDPQNCTLTSTPGPVGYLIDYQLTGASEWMLTRSEDGRSTLWEDSGAGWHSRPFGTTCIAGVMTIGPDDHPRVACLVRAGAAMVYDLRVFDVGPTQSSSTLVAAGELGAGYVWNALPLAISVDAVGRPTLLWQSASGLDPGLYHDCGLARATGEAWYSVGYYDTVLDRSTVLVPAGEELRILYRDEVAGAVVIKRAGVELTPVAELPGAEHAFAVAGALHITTIGADASGLVAGGGVAPGLAKNAASTDDPPPGVHALFGALVLDLGDALDETRDDAVVVAEHRDSRRRRSDDTSASSGVITVPAHFGRARS